MQPIIGFIPCRRGSERVKAKNTRAFASFSNGLLELKLRQMSKIPDFEKIIISSNDPIVLDFVQHFRKIDSRFQPLERPEALGSSATSMEEFTNYIAELERSGIIFWTHVTSPFLNSEHFRQIIDKYKEIEHQGYDSLTTVTQIHKFIWSKDGPYNYDNITEKWPRSQDLMPLFEINHGAYMLSFQQMRDSRDRIGSNPYLYNLSEFVSLDVDWEDQFQLIEDIARAKEARGISLI